MIRNTDSHFGNSPMKNINRSKFKMPSTYSTTGNTGEIIPIFTQEILPGDTLKIKTSQLVRMTTPITPVMDNAWIDTYYFFVPRRLVWNHWTEFMGENTTDAWTQETEYQIPQLTTPEGGWQKGTLGEKLYGIQGREGSVDACYARAYVKIFNEWFRNENITEPAEMSDGDATTQGSNGTDYVVDMQKGGQLAIAVKYADYFTRALPEPSKGPDVYLPLGDIAPIGFARGNAGLTAARGYTFEAATTDGQYQNQAFRLYSNGQLDSENRYDNVDVEYRDDLEGTFQNHVPLVLDPTGYVTDLKNATAATINELRQAFAVQRLYEVDARGGTRYTEILRAHFGVVSPDSRLQRPEYLGGKRTPINISQVIQQSATSPTSPQGTTAAYSLTIDTHEDFTQSFTEHGIVIGLAVIRTEHTYQQGIDRKFSRKNKLDFYFPELANIGEQPIFEKEIFATGTSTDDDVFGYQEPWAEYRYMQNRVTGELNSDYAQSLDIWTWADDFEEAPTLSDKFIRETKQNVERTLAIQNQDQWKFNFYFDTTMVRPLPIYSIPSLAGWN